MRNWFKRSIDYIFDKALIISGVSLVALSVVDISNINDITIDIFGIDNFQIGKLLYYVSVIFSIVFGVFAVVHAKEVQKLEEENNKKSSKINDLESKLNEVVSETNDLFNSYLRLLIKNLNFTHNERISVYKVYENKFKLIGRTSVDPILTQMGRKEYPIGEGFIGKGWREGDFFIDSLPDCNAKSGNTYYNAVNTIHPIKREVVDNLKMKSRTFFVYRINGYDGTPKAVLVFESLEMQKFTKEFIIEKLNGVKQPLIMFIEKNNGVVITENILGV
ncbi:MAG: hypothetical protein ACRCTQ_07135 [Brevinemataceae bacterium]